MNHALVAMSGYYRENKLSCRQHFADMITINICDFADMLPHYVTVIHYASVKTYFPCSLTNNAESEEKSHSHSVRLLKYLTNAKFFV